MHPIDISVPARTAAIVRFNGDDISTVIRWHNLQCGDDADNTGQNASGIDQRLDALINPVNFDRYALNDGADLYAIACKQRHYRCRAWRNRH